VEVENLARTYVIVRALGEPRLLDRAEMARVLERFSTYGQARRT
jgi:L-fuculose-phosphate aldolase